MAQLFGSYDLTSSQPTKVIVELQEPSILQAKHSGKQQSAAALKGKRQEVISKVKAISASKVGEEYDHVFSGFSLELPANRIPQLLTVPGIKAVYPDLPYTTADVGQTEMVPEELYSPHLADSAPYIGAAKAWESGYTGKGIKVAIIDTGVDYTHPDLAGRFGAYKGWDFVDDDADPQETPVGDPRGAATDHGTHVAGIVAANGLIKGVAPEATLLAYRVLGPGGSGSSEDVVAGIEKAVEDGADVMNLSLGNILNDPDWVTSIALDTAMEEGVVAVTSNGNSGPANWTVGSPGTSRSAISVGASQLPYNLYDVTLDNPGTSLPSAKVLGYDKDEQIQALNGKTWEVVYAGLGQAADFNGIDVKGKIALISRGVIPFVDKAQNAANAGAVATIIYNNGTGEIPFYIPGMAVPSIKLTKEDGLKLLEQVRAGNATVTVTTTLAQHVGETVADFSSRGPVVQTWMIKPDVVAPGVDIVSTVPGGYGSKQGTSMASPHVAGTAALLLQAHPDWSPFDVKAALMNTAERLTNPLTGTGYPHNTQGAGSIRIVDALSADTLVLPGSYSFGVFSKDKGNQVEHQKFTLKNLSNQKKTYTIDFHFNGNPDGIKVTAGKNLSIKPHDEEKVNLKVQVDASALQPGYYEGMITVSDGSKEIQVPTILFVKEPDYPRITYFGSIATGSSFILEAFYPNGAEQAGFWVFDPTLETFYGEVLTQTNTDKLVSLTWDGTVNGQRLAPGTYYLVAYAYKAGKTDYMLDASGPITIK